MFLISEGKTVRLAEQIESIHQRRIDMELVHQGVRLKWILTVATCQKCYGKRNEVGPSQPSDSLKSQFNSLDLSMDSDNKLHFLFLDSR